MGHLTNAALLAGVGINAYNAYQRSGFDAGLGSVLGGIEGGDAGDAVGGGAGRVIGSVLGSLGVGRGLGAFTSQKIVQPTQKVIQQEENENDRKKGTLRPKVIIPSVQVLDIPAQEIQADRDEWTAFDYVMPTSEGADGNILNNSLKKQQYQAQQVILTNAGIDLFSQYGEPIPSGEQLKKQLLGTPELSINNIPVMMFNLSEYEVKSYDVNNSRTAIDMFSPYVGFTEVLQLNDPLRRSQLYGVVA